MDKTFISEKPWGFCLSLLYTSSELCEDGHQLAGREEGHGLEGRGPARLLLLPTMEVFQAECSLKFREL